MKPTFLLLALGCCLTASRCSAAAASPERPLEIRLATILPANLGQDFILKQLEQDWNRVSGGTVVLRRAPSGRKDGEATIIRKLQSRNYQAALVSVVGLSSLAPDTAALQMMPLTYQDWQEVDYVREKLRPRLEASLRQKGYVTLFWADSGWVNFFSVKKATTPAEFKRLKLFVWAGDEKQVAMMKSLGYQPIALETDNLHSGFATGMIEAAPITPTFALGVFIPTLAPHMLEVNWAPIVGAAIIRQDAWDKIPAALQPKLLALCEKAGADIRSEGRKFNQEAVATLRKGPKSQVHTPTPEERAQWQELARALGPKVRGELVPPAVFDEVQQLLKEYRAAKSAAK